MNDLTLKKRSRYLSWLLRHGAIESRLPMDAAGWARIDDVLSKTRLSRSVLDVIVARNNKSRLEIDGDRIRASQGHSLEGVPVTQDALEASWTIYRRPGNVFHGTQPDAVPGIAELGILRRARSHVHLADRPQSRVGKRANIGVLLEISPQKLRDAGQELFVSPNGVVLTRHVPVEAIVALRPLSRRARKQQQTLRELLKRTHDAKSLRT
ncbi:MAG: tRNA 2'-phosphotransferase [Myxococcota bacterium]